MIVKSRIFDLLMHPNAVEPHLFNELDVLDKGFVIGAQSITTVASSPGPGPAFGNRAGRLKGSGRSRRRPCAFRNRIALHRCIALCRAHGTGHRTGGDVPATKQDLHRNSDIRWLAGSTFTVKLPAVLWGCTVMVVTGVP